VQETNINRTINISKSETLFRSTFRNSAPLQPPLFETRWLFIVLSLTVPRIYGETFFLSSLPKINFRSVIKRAESSSIIMPNGKHLSKLSETIPFVI
jgi:hypothetical protein